MGRGGGGGSPSRSTGSGSGSRSFGGRSSSSARGRSSGSHNRGGSSYSSGYHPHSGPHIHYNTYHSGYGNYGGYQYGHSSGWNLVGWFILLTFLILAISIFSMFSAGSTAAKSTVEREAVKPYAAFDRDCIDDGAGWIHDRATLLSGMESFYKKTGVQPALAIYETIDGETYLPDAEIETFMNEEYDSLIGHERGLLVLFCEYADSDYYVYYMAGEDAQTVMDSEACGILMDYVHGLYEGNWSDEQYFGAVFEKTGDRIMTVTPTIASKIPVIVFGIVMIAGLVTVVIIIKLKHKRAAEHARETERILRTPVDHI